MSKLCVACFSVSLDGYGAGPEQSLENPMGRGAMGLHTWFMGTRVFRQMHGEGGDLAPGDAIDEAFAARGNARVGAWILGRNMFGPVRGPWPDEAWKGWWGDAPPYQVDTFVLTHHPRPPLVMQGGTTFHFVTGGIHEALTRARTAAKGRDIRLGGGVATVRQYLAAGLLDALHLAFPPVLLGRGEALFAGLDLPALGYHLAERVASPHATHVVLARRR